MALQTECAAQVDASTSNQNLHFFVRTYGLPTSTLVMHANSEDTVSSLLSTIGARTGMPAGELRLLHRGKQMRFDAPDRPDACPCGAAFKATTLADYHIRKDSTVQLLGHLRSALFPEVWQIVSRMENAARALVESERATETPLIKVPQSEGERLKDNSLLVAQDHVAKRRRRLGNEHATSTGHDNCGNHTSKGACQFVERVQVGLSATEQRDQASQPGDRVPAGQGNNVLECENESLHFSSVSSGGTPFHVPEDEPVELLQHGMVLGIGDLPAGVKRILSGSDRTMYQGMNDGEHVGACVLPPEFGRDEVSLQHAQLQLQQKRLRTNPSPVLPSQQEAATFAPMHERSSSRKAEADATIRQRGEFSTALAMFLARAIDTACSGRDGWQTKLTEYFAAFRAAGGVQPLLMLQQLQSTANKKFAHGMARSLLEAQDMMGLVKQYTSGPWVNSSTSVVEHFLLPVILDLHSFLEQNPSLSPWLSHKCWDSILTQLRLQDCPGATQNSPISTRSIVQREKSQHNSCCSCPGNGILESGVDPRWPEPLTVTGAAPVTCSPCSSLTVRDLLPLLGKAASQLCSTLKDNTLVMDGQQQTLAHPLLVSTAQVFTTLSLAISNKSTTVFSPYSTSAKGIWMKEHEWQVMSSIYQSCLEQLVLFFTATERLSTRMAQLASQKARPRGRPSIHHYSPYNQQSIEERSRGRGISRSSSSGGGGGSAESMGLSSHTTSTSSYNLAFSHTSGSSGNHTSSGSSASSGSSGPSPASLVDQSSPVDDSLTVSQLRQVLPLPFQEVLPTIIQGLWALAMSAALHPSSAHPESKLQALKDALQQHRTILNSFIRARHLAGPPPATSESGSESLAAAERTDGLARWSALGVPRVNAGSLLGRGGELGFLCSTDEWRALLDERMKKRWMQQFLHQPSEDFDERFTIVVHRGSLFLPESFEQLNSASADDLRRGLAVHFVGEEAAGAGVLREWFLMIGQEMLSGQFSPFQSCPFDKRRFFPQLNLGDTHCSYFSTCGRVVSLALSHSATLGITFALPFINLLAGRHVSLEDCSTVDPALIKSCSDIMNMDPADVDADVLGLTFSHTIERWGQKDGVELCPGGKNIQVTSANRQRFVELLVAAKLMEPMREAAGAFAKGMAEVLKWRPPATTTTTTTDCNSPQTGNMGSLEESDSEEEFEEVFLPTDLETLQQRQAGWVPSLQAMHAAWRPLSNRSRNGESERRASRRRLDGGGYQPKGCSVAEEEELCQQLAAVKALFRPLNIGDFDRLIAGTESRISVKDWKRHTDYLGYTESDLQIKWFWEILEGMPEHQLRRFLYFCTAIHRLPPTGFAGLHCRFQVDRGMPRDVLLPTAHTCFLQIILPPYSSQALMKARLEAVTSSYILQGFGLL